MENSLLIRVTTRGDLNGFLRLKKATKESEMNKLIKWWKLRGTGHDSICEECGKPYTKPKFIKGRPGALPPIRCGMICRSKAIKKQGRPCA